jgi:hypothetical protein
VAREVWSILQPLSHYVVVCGSCGGVHLVEARFVSCDDAGGVDRRTTRRTVMVQHHDLRTTSYNHVHITKEQMCEQAMVSIVPFKIQLNELGTNISIEFWYSDFRTAAELWYNDHDV